MTRAGPDSRPFFFFPPFQGRNCIALGPLWFTRLRSEDSMADEKWMQHAGEKMEEKGTKGSFTRMAKKKGESVAKLAHEDAHKPGKVGKKARFALMAEKVARKHRG